MKTIKIILGIIIALTLVFFATGLIFKETKYTTEVNINKPISEVFTLFNDSSKTKEWIPELESIEEVDIKPGKIGSIYKMVIKNSKGEIINLQERVMAYVPNEKVTLFFNADNMLKKDDYSFSFKDGVTTIRNNSICRSNSYILGCVFPYFKSTFKKQDQGYLDNFKRVAEKQ